MLRKILVVEDDPEMAAYVVKGLGEAGFMVDHVANGRDALFHAVEGGYGAIVLDRKLPGMDGLSVLAATRAAGIDTPVVILSAAGSLDERVRGLEAGADDYIVKPFGFSELLARLRALGRRGTGQEIQTTLNCGDLEMDLLSHKVRRGDRVLDLQPREFRLLEYFLRHRDEVVTRTMMLESVWGYHFDPGTNVIDVHVSRLRKKIIGDSGTELLHTVRGAGYRLGVEP